MELIFLYFGIEASLTKTFKYFFDMPVMFRHVVEVNEYVIQIDYDINIQNIGKKVILELIKKLQEYW